MSKQKKMLENEVKMAITDGLHKTDGMSPWAPHVILNPAENIRIIHCYK